MNPKALQGPRAAAALRGRVRQLHSSVAWLWLEYNNGMIGCYLLDSHLALLLNLVCQQIRGITY
jgi:hypothetical protein